VAFVAAALLVCVRTSVLRSASTASLAERLGLSLLTPSSAAPVAHDFDGDGILDEARLTASDRVSVRLSSAAGRLTLDAPERIVGLASIDIDRDGDVDLVAFLGGGGSIVWINDGHGAFAPAAAQPRDRRPAQWSSQSWVTSWLFAPLGVGSSQPAWLARPPTVSTVLARVDGLVAPATSPRTTLGPSWSERGPPSISL
jgi:hypothetical protein